DTEPEHKTKWSADKITAHEGLSTNAIFEVLWKAGDKIWLPYNQVRELDLVSLYLDAQSVDTIDDLPTGTGTLPANDPQVFLESLAPENLFKQSSTQTCNQPPPASNHSLLFSTYNSLVNYPTASMSFRPKNHYIPHLCLVAQPNGFVQLTSVEHNLIIHPAQLQKFVEHNASICSCSATATMIEPVSYESFAKVYNASKGDNPCQFILRDPQTDLYDYNSFSIPKSLFNFPIIDNCYAKFCAFGIINAQGDINRHVVRYQARSESHREEKEIKRHHNDDVNPDGLRIHLSYNKGKKKRSNKEQSPSGVTEPSDPDDSMPVNKFIDKTTLEA
ncbi:hypothetical protein C0992_001764, partial [Termitomyces sp. T32_za158]